MTLFDPSALLERLPTLLPPDAKSLASPQDAIVALLHTMMVTVAFRLIAVDEAPSNISDLANILPKEWNKFGPSNYTLRYKHEQSSLEFLLKVIKLGPRTLINAIALQNDKTTSLDIATTDFTSPSFFPRDLSASGAQPIVHGFISSSRVSDLVSQYKLKILQNLIPNLNKEGYTEQPDLPASRTEPAPSRAQPQLPRQDPDDEFMLRQPPRFPLQNPLSIGRRDLDPFPGINPFQPPPLFPDAGGDGMYVGPNHPIFAGRTGGPAGVRGPWGGDGYLPPMGAPPGARFDPVSPAIGPFPGPGRTLGPRAQRGGDPDNDEFMPPGMGDMFM